MSKIIDQNVDKTESPATKDGAENNINKFSYSIDQARQRCGRVGRTKMYEEIASGRLKARKFGKRTIILHDDLNAFLAGLENYPISGRRV